MHQFKVVRIQERCFQVNKAEIIKSRDSLSGQHLDIVKGTGTIIVLVQDGKRLDEPLI
jgi:hypothetical protein